MNRIAFLAQLGLGAGSLILSCSLGGCRKNNTEESTPASPAPDNKVDFSFDTTADAHLASRGWTVRNNVIIARSGAAYLAFEALCPHQNFLLTYDAAANQFPCSNTGPNHGSVFDNAGKRVAGPSHRDLKQYQTTLTGTNLRVYE